MILIKLICYWIIGLSILHIKEENRGVLMLGQNYSSGYQMKSKDRQKAGGMRSWKLVAKFWSLQDWRLLLCFFPLLGVTNCPLLAIFLIFPFAADVVMHLIMLACLVDFLAPSWWGCGWSLVVFSCCSSSGGAGDCLYVSSSFLSLVI